MSVPVGTRPAASARSRRPPERTAGPAARVRVLAEVALVPVVLSYAAVVVLAALITAAASGADPGGDPGLAQAPAIGVTLWLAVHLVPLTIAGAPLGVLPLGPALAVGALVAAVARRGLAGLAAVTPPGAGEDADTPLTARHDRWSALAVPVVATVAAVHAAGGVLAAAMLTPDTAPVPADASPATAGTVAGLLAALAALAGVARPCGARARWDRIPAFLRRGLRTGLAAAAALLASGAVVLLVALLVHVRAVVDLATAIAPDAGSGAGLWLLQAAYLPGTVVAGTAWALGPGYAVGAVGATPLTASPGLVPPLPLAALLPSGPPPTWAALVFALPLAVGSLVGWRLAPAGESAADRLRAVVVAALTCGTALGLAAALAGGRLGTGPFDPVTLHPGAVLLAAAAWVAVPGATIALLAVPGGVPDDPGRDPGPDDPEPGRDADREPDDDHGATDDEVVGTPAGTDPRATGTRD